MCRKRKTEDGGGTAAPGGKRSKGDTEKQLLLRVSVFGGWRLIYHGGCGSRSKERLCGK